MSDVRRRLGAGAPARLAGCGDGTLLDAELSGLLAEIVASLMDEIEITRRLAA
jgi:hypothetical protein